MFWISINLLGGVENMTINEIKKAYGFNQRVFYKWLNDVGIIKKGDYGYLAGPNALPSMKDFKGTTKKHGTNIIFTQVVAYGDDITEIVERFNNSGLAKHRNKSSIDKEVEILKQLLGEINVRLDILEERVGLE